MKKVVLLGLAGLVSIGTLVSFPPIQTLSAITQNSSIQSPASSQDYSESRELARRVAALIYEQTPTVLRWPEEYIYGASIGKEFIDKITGEDITEQVNEKFRRLITSNPQNIRSVEPEEIYDGIQAHHFISSYLSFDGRIQNQDISGWVETKVYTDQNYRKKWDDPKNYLKLALFDNSTQRWTSFTDQGIIGIVSRSWSPFLADKQRAYVEHLRKIEGLFLQK